MKYLPIFADVGGKKCLLVGSGPLIEAKESMLREAGAVTLRRDFFSSRDAENVMLIVADVADDEAERIRRYGEAQHIFVNIIDKPQFCTFISPALLRQQDLLVAISSSGKSPALSSWIRRNLEQQFSRGYADLLVVLGRTREQVKRILPDYADRREFYRRMLDRGLVEVAKTRGREAAAHEFERFLERFRREKHS